MVQVYSPVDCGNAPRKQVLKDFNVAFARGDVQAILVMLHDEIVWHMIGDRTLQGKEAVAAVLREMQDEECTELHIHHIITHGSEAALNGTMTMKDGRRYAFCDVYVFAGFSKSAKIKEITSYGTYV